MRTIVEFARGTISFGELTSEKYLESIQYIVSAAIAIAIVICDVPHISQITKIDIAFMPYLCMLFMLP